ncbi:MAG: secretin N-terminal domain-containing protein [Synechococcaceae cyanobacterium]|nr:secretin N-terminal domain-containing protein [Synechococcaceae cyanobacterium]
MTPVQGMPLGRPLVSADGRDLILSFSAPNQASLQLAAPNLNQPGRVDQPDFVPPLQPRAAAPPLGDIAVGTMVLRNPSFIQVSGPPVTMTLKNAPAKDVLMALSQLGGYGFVYVEDQGGASGSSGQGSGSSGQSAAASSRRPISIAFRNESYSRALNSALLAAGLQAKREGNMILAGPNVLTKSFGAQMSKVYRLNQASANSAADYLANLGATINKTFTTTSVTSETQSTGTPANNQASGQTQTASTTQIESYGASQGPLRGLIGTTDTRLGTVTLVGDPRLVAIAENYLRQLDLRQRQVALSLRILDVDMNNATDIDNSFAMRMGNSFIVSESGKLIGAFGRYLPPSGAQFSALNPFEPTRSLNPGMLYPKDNFYDLLKAQITSSKTKVLASPTLILQENASLLREGSSETEVTQSGTTTVGQGVSLISLNTPIGRRRANEAVVRVGTNVVTNYTLTTSGTTNNQVFCTPQLSTAGLVLGARVEKIDDNGFVTFTLSPQVSGVVATEDGPDGCNSRLNILNVRSLDTGAIRVRDGQTLILTGVISDLDRSEVKKWPILGDLPFVGQFFRSTNGERQKRELVIMVTPRIINDVDGGLYGYGYEPTSMQTRQMLQTPN